LETTVRRTTDCAPLTHVIQYAGLWHGVSMSRTHALRAPTSWRGEVPHIRIATAADMEALLAVERKAFGGDAEADLVIAVMAGAS